jgi:GTP pyrophosphokinase
MSEEVRSDATASASATSPLATPARMRARFARFGGPRTGNPVLEPILQTVRTTHPKADLTVIEKAYAVAEEYHRGQLRKSGDAYITHPLAVTTDPRRARHDARPRSAAALLHDTVEDTAYTMPQLRRDFGEEIAGPRRRRDQSWTG